MNSETKWNSAGNTLREKKNHTKHLLKYTYHEKPKGFQTHRIQIYAKLRIAHVMLEYELVCLTAKCYVTWLGGDNFC